MTELMRLYLENREAAIEKIKKMDAALLVAELDDTVQFDMMNMPTTDYASLPQQKAGVFRVIRKEIFERLDTAERKARAGKTWADDDGYAGHYDSEGREIVDFEPGTDRDFDTYAVQVQNDEGYYDDNGKFHYNSDGDDFEYDSFDIDD